MPNCSGTHQRTVNINKLTDLTKIGVKIMNRYQPKKQKQPVKAIRKFCIECMGGEESEGHIKRISECGSQDCPLYDFRFGKNPYHSQNLTDEQRKERGERLRSSIPRH